MNHVLFFGCANGRVGHYLLAPIGCDLQMARMPIERQICSWDGQLAPKTKQNIQREGEATISFFRKAETPFAVLAFWDRSVDTRMGSNAMFAVPMEMIGGFVNEIDVIREAKAAFPEIWARFKFEVNVIRCTIYHTWPVEL